MGDDGLELFEEGVVDPVAGKFSAPWHH